MPRFDQPLTHEQAAAFSGLALDCIVTEYPNKPGQVMLGEESVLTPRQLHPVFYGCFDWHSAVHGHWLLVRLLKLYPGHPAAELTRSVLEAQFSTQALLEEAEYFDEDQNRSFERMYGWAWLLRLAVELRTFEDPYARQWLLRLAPLEQRIVALMMGYLPRLDWPVRTGVHPNTAFALGQGLDYARATGQGELQQLLVERSLAYYAADRAYPVNYEPSGEDFFSAALAEADLMRRVLDSAEYSDWLDGFFPALREGELGRLLQPATVSDVTDGKIVHLAGLNLHRAWTMRSVARALPAGDPRAGVLLASAVDHMAAGLDYVFSGHYEGEHWLATFAIYGLTDVDARQ
ncbi:MAG: DUF2891 domain-containing protein [Gammaproteobacteria bacterium]|nr:DUF2891 domain-containing protein [Gammaproteobacteria bacterium]MYF66790.1 DUF2891 domain-containing protein [Gammaproteobacteria bacterium]MYK37326.1 DUF2891 domain-containing protein [Gammaproteobacteria bacterium]